MDQYQRTQNWVDQHQHRHRAFYTFFGTKAGLDWFNLSWSPILCCQVLLGYVLRDAFETTCLRYFLKCMCHICVSYTCTNCFPIDKVKLCEGCKTSWGWSGCLAPRTRCPNMHGTSHPAGVAAVPVRHLWSLGYFGLDFQHRASCRWPFRHGTSKTTLVSGCSEMLNQGCQRQTWKKPRRVCPVGTMTALNMMLVSQLWSIHVVLPLKEESISRR